MNTVVPATPVRLTVVDTHPIQYTTAWFRHIARHCREIDLTVLYVAKPSPSQQGVGFDRAFEWDSPPLEGYRYQFIRDEVPGATFSSSTFRGLDVREVGTALLATEPDVALMPGWHSISLARAIASCLGRRVPTLYRGDTHLGSHPAGWRAPLWSAKTRALLATFSGHLAVGRRSREYLEAHGVAPSRIFAAPHAVDNEFFSAIAAPHLEPNARIRLRESFRCAADDFVVLFAGKLAAHKRVVDLLRASAALDMPVRILVAGSGECEADLRREAARLNVRVTWLGFVNQSDMGRAYAAADCLVLPSESESWGLVVNEALATGLPAVVSDRVGCAPDLVVSGVTGEQYRCGDISGLAAALVRVRDAGGRTCLAEACRAASARHSFEQTTAGLVAACQAVRRQPEKSPARVIACCGGMVIVAGLERMTFEVLRVVRQQGGRVHCVVNGWENHRIVALAEEIGATWSTGFYQQTFTRRPGLRQVIGMLRDVGRTSAGLMRDAVRVRPTHVLLPDYLAAIRNALTLPVLRMAGVTVVLRLGNAPEAGRFYRYLWRWVVNPLVDRFVCNSDFTERELRGHGIRAQKVTRIYNTAPPRDCRQSADEPDPHRIVYVGQVIPEKGLDALVEAVALLAARGCPATLDVVGNVDGWIAPGYEPFRKALLARVRSADLTSRIRFLGWREDVDRILENAAVHCCPSQPQQREAFGVVTLEAKLAGIPSVVTPYGALPELVTHRVDGWITSDGSAGAIAEGLEYFLSDSAKRRRAGLAARASAARFSRDKFESEWQGVFNTPAGQAVTVVRGEVRS